MSLMMNKTVFLFCGVWLIGCIAYFLGYQYASNKCDIKTAETVAEAQEQYANALEKKNEIQSKMATVVDKSQSDLATSIEQTTANYDSLISTDLRIPDEWVQSDSNTTDSESGSVPSDTRTTEPVSGTQCKCVKDNGAKLQRLYKQQLIVARDCDITTSYYNSLLKLYNGIKNAEN